jgi:hypothetical protein
MSLVRWQGAVLGPDAPRRRLPRLSGWRTDDPALRDRYDTNTLVYGAAWLAPGIIRAYTPPPLNLAPLLAGARWSTAAGQLPAPRLRHFKRYTTLDLPCPTPVASVRLETAGWAGEIPVVPQAPEAFAGRNVLYTMSQDNDLDWLRDWVRYHHRAHRADAVLLADNRSTAYPPEAVLEVLRAMPELKASIVLSVPYRYGPSSAIVRRASSARYLQAATANFARDVWLGRARAVLSCDIDELVVSRTNRSVFDVARASRWGVVTFPGYWRFCDPGLPAPRHADHTLARPDRAEPCPSKYAYDPNGRLKGWSLMTHCFESVPRRWVSGAPDLWFAHCHGITTRWKPGREATPAGAAGTPDPGMVRALERGGLGPVSASPS